VLEHRAGLSRCCWGSALWPDSSPGGTDGTWAARDAEGQREPLIGAERRLRWSASQCSQKPLVSGQSPSVDVAGLVANLLREADGWEPRLWAYAFSAVVLYSRAAADRLKSRVSGPP
jgi:hypothetical protein